MVREANSLLAREESRVQLEAIEFAGNLESAKGNWWKPNSFGRESLTSAQVAAGRILLREGVRFAFAIGRAARTAERPGSGDLAERGRPTRSRSPTEDWGTAWTVAKSSPRYGARSRSNLQTPHCKNPASSCARASCSGPDAVCCQCARGLRRETELRGIRRRHKYGETEMKTAGYGQDHDIIRVPRNPPTIFVKPPM